MAEHATSQRAPNAALLVRLHLAGMVGVGVWGLFLLGLGHRAGAIAELVYLLFLTPSVIWVYHTERHIVPDVWANIAGVFINGVAITWLCDGIVGSGAFVVWSFICPMAAMVWVSLRASLLTSLFYLLLLVLLTVFGQALPGGHAPPAEALPWMITYNLIGAFCLVLLTLGWFIARLDDERRQNLASQARLLESQRFESLATLAGGVAHDFNNAFMAISGNLQLARNDVEPSNPLLGRIERAQCALERASGLAHQMLAYSSGGAPRKSTTPFAETIERAARFVLSGSQVRLEFSQQPQISDIPADADQLSRLVQQLVTNAAQAMPGGGTVSLRLDQRTRERELAPLTAGQRCLVLEVADQGAGIAQEHVARIFDPFFTTREGHAGLGLTEAFTIARDHGGAIEASSNPGQGSVFRVWLPAPDPPRADRLAPLDAPTPRAGRLAAPPKASASDEPPTILVMDDESAVLEVLSQMLELLGYRVLATPDGAAAVQAWARAQAQGQPLDAAIFDLTVKGGMGGVEAARRLRELSPDALIVASSGYVSDRALADFRQHGFDAVLRKPYRISDLSDTLVQTLSLPAGNT